MGTGNGQITLTYTLPGTTIGQVFTPSRSLPCVSLTPCGSYLQLGVATGSRYTVPFDGVITSWSFQADASPPSSPTSFIAARACCGTRDSYTTVGAAPASAITANELNIYPARIRVQAGDVIGLSTGDGDFYWYARDTEDQAAAAPSGIDVGGSASYSSQQFETEYGLTGGSRLDVSAQVEPDADRDGFGDVSQDACPGVLGIVAGLPAGGPLGHPEHQRHQRAGRRSGHLHPCRRQPWPEDAPGVVLTDSLPAGATLISVTTSGGACSFATTVSCDLGTLAPGAGATVTITVQLTRAGTAVSTARVDSSVLDSAHAKVPGAGDTNPANDATTANVAVAPASSSTPSGGSAPQGAGRSSSPPSTILPIRRRDPALARDHGHRTRRASPPPQPTSGDGQPDADDDCDVARARGPPAARAAQDDRHRPRSVCPERGQREAGAGSPNRPSARPSTRPPRPPGTRHRGGDRRNPHEPDDARALVAPAAKEADAALTR